MLVSIIHVCRDFGENMSDEAGETPAPNAKQDLDGPSRLFALTSQGIDPITGEYRPSPKEIAKYKERKDAHELRVFLIFGVPIGFVLAMFIGISSNLGNAGFFCCWAVCSFVAGAVLNSVMEKKKNR